MCGAAPEGLRETGDRAAAVCRPGRAAGGSMKKSMPGILALLGSAFLWATAYVFVKQMVAEIPPSFLLALRFSLAALILLVFYSRRLKQITLPMLKGGIWMGIFLFGEFFTFTVGLQYTTASRSSFIISGYIILVPVAYLIIRRKLPKKADILVSAVCLVGVCFIMGGGLGTDFRIGDIYCLACAACYAFYVVVSAKHSRNYDTGLLNLIQIATTAVLACGGALISGDLFTKPTLPQFTGILYLAVVCSVIPFFLCLYGMRFVSTTASGILLSTECVFAAILAVIFLRDPVYWQLVVGGCIIFGSFLLSEVLARLGTSKTVQ